MSDSNVLMEKIALAIYETARDHFAKADVLAREEASAREAHPLVVAAVREDLRASEAERLLAWIRGVSGAIRADRDEQAPPAQAPAAPVAEAAEPATTGEPMQMSLLPDEPAPAERRGGKHKQPRRNWVSHPEIGPRMLTYSMSYTQNRKRALEYKQLADNAKGNKLTEEIYLSMYRESNEKAREFKRKYDNLIKTTLRREQKKQESGSRRRGSSRPR